MVEVIIEQGQHAPFCRPFALNLIYAHRAQGGEMKSWILDAPQSLTLQDAPPTVLSPDQVKIKLEEIMITSSDFSIYQGQNKIKYPLVLGRNAVGVVSDRYDKNGTQLQKMDRVVVEPYLPCEACVECLDGDISRCSNMQELGLNSDGVLKNFADLPYTLLHKLPDNLSNERALYTSYVAFCLNVVEALKLEKGRHIAIFSSTRTGIILAQLIAYYQAIPVYISENEELLKLAREMGVFYCFNPNEVSVEKEIMMVTGGRMCKELVFFSNSDFRMKDVYDSAAVNANICLAGYSNKESKLSVAQICQKHLNVFGVFNGAGKFSSAINMLVTETVNVDRLLGDTVSFDTLDASLAKYTDDDFITKSLIVKVD